MIDPAWSPLIPLCAPPMHWSCPHPNRTPAVMSIIRLSAVIVDSPAGGGRSGIGGSSYPERGAVAGPIEGDHTNPAPITLLPTKGSWNKSCSVVSLLDGVLRAVCNLPNNQLSAVNLTLCSPGASLAQAHGQLICSALASGMPLGPTRT